MNREVEAALDACLPRLARGETVEQCLADYGAVASELRPLLEAAAALRTGGAAIPEASAQKAASGRLRMHAVRSRQAEGRSTGRPLRSGLGLVAVAAAVVLLVGGGLTTLLIDFGGGTTRAQAVGTVSSTSPSAIVLSTDRGPVSVQIGGHTAVFDSSGNLIAVDQIVPGARARVEFEEDEGGLSGWKVEIEEDDDGSSGAEVEFSGVIRSIADGSLTLESSFGTPTVRIDSATEVNGRLQPGVTVEVHAIVSPDGSYAAREIKVENESEDEEQDSGSSESRGRAPGQASTETVWSDRDDHSGADESTLPSPAVEPED